LPQILAADVDFYERVLDNLHDGVYFVDRDRQITYWNRGAQRITGYTSEEVLGRCCHDNLLMHSDRSGSLLCFKGCPVIQTVQDGQAREGDVFVKHREGHRIPVHIRVSPIFDTDGTIIGAVETFSDNSAKIAALERANQLEQIAYLDALTGLGNRRYAEMTLEQHFEAFQQHGSSFAVLFCDIDHFKLVNDRWGHHAGDSVLRMIAQTLTHNLRSYDFVARWGGDEFLLIVPEANEADVGRVARRCLDLVRTSHLTWNGDQVSVTMSVGIAIPEVGESALSLIRRADDLLYEAKSMGRNRLAR
jgi:diguanylate cyclase (GGDEF)-like protein/PAS domain S-box-containing protein